ncbi:hypothetical protein K2X83_01935 [Patescibacteria group bacterium]|nr:hypothetical protein [Patescibacteria group bacterium]
MDELDVGGKKYISSKRASELTGYAKDYIGQLLRAGKVSGTRFGRAWYVEESEILRHAGKGPVLDVPVGVPAQEEPAAPAPVAQRAVKPLLTHHMITPAVLPKTWSTIQYLEDTSDLFPSLTPSSSEVTLEKKPEKDSVSEAVPVHVIPNRASVDKRVATLVDGIRPRPPMLRVATPSVSPVMKKSQALPVLRPMSDVVLPPTSTSVKQEQKIVQEIKPLQPLQKTLLVRWSPGSFATVAALFIFVFGSFMSFFFFTKVGTGNAEALTASTFYGLTDFLDLLKNARILDGGIEAVSSFWRLLSDSFFVFLKSGADFILNLF